MFIPAWVNEIVSPQQKQILLHESSIILQVLKNGERLKNHQCLIESDIGDLIIDSKNRVVLTLEKTEESK